jgi:hypothetical protein
LSLKWLRIDFSSCGPRNARISRVPTVLPERIKVIRDPNVQTRYLRTAQIAQALNKAVASVDNPHVYFRVRTNGTPLLETIYINGKQTWQQSLFSS